MPWVGMYFCSCFVCLWLSLAPKRPDIIYLSEMDCCIEKPTNKQTRSLSVRRNLSYPHFSLLYPNIKMKVVIQCDKCHNMRRHKAYLAYCCNLRVFWCTPPPKLWAQAVVRHVIDEVTTELLTPLKTAMSKISFKSKFCYCFNMAFF